MAPGTNAGAAHTVLLFGPTSVKPDDEMKQKIENDSAMFDAFRGFAARAQRGRRGERGTRIEIVH